MVRTIRARLARGKGSGDRKGSSCSFARPIWESAPEPGGAGERTETRNAARGAPSRRERRRTGARGLVAAIE
jgi:hypothetical protein